MSYVITVKTDSTYVADVERYLDEAVSNIDISRFQISDTKRQTRVIIEFSKINPEEPDLHILVSNVRNAEFLDLLVKAEERVVGSRV